MTRRFFNMAGGLILAAVWLGACASGGPATPSLPTLGGSATPSPRFTGALDAGGVELAALLGRMPGLTFHARYRSRAEGIIAAGKGQVGLELWSEPPRFRRDASISRGTDFVRTIEIDDGTRPVRCVKSGPNEAWKCARGDAGANIAGSSIFDVIQEAIHGATVTPRNATVGGRPARCFRIVPALASPTASRDDVCVTPDGIPLLIDSGSLALELTTLDRVIPESTFKPPAVVR